MPQFTLSVKWESQPFKLLSKDKVTCSFLSYTTQCLALKHAINDSHYYYIHTWNPKANQGICEEVRVLVERPRHHKPEPMAEFYKGKGCLHYQVWPRRGQEHESIKATSAKLLGWSHWKGDKCQETVNRQPSSTSENNEKRPEGTIPPYIFVPFPFFLLSRSFLYCFKTQFERALDMFKDRKKLRAELTTSWKFPATARIVSWPHPISLRRPNRFPP